MDNNQMAMVSNGNLCSIQTQEEIKLTALRWAVYQMFIKLVTQVINSIQGDTISLDQILPYLPSKIQALITTCRSIPFLNQYLQISLSKQALMVMAENVLKSSISDSAAIMVYNEMDGMVDRLKHDYANGYQSLCRNQPLNQ